MVEEEKVETDLVTQANISAERIEKAITVNQELIKRMEALESRRILGGRTEATNVEQVKEETPQEYAKKIMSGKV